MHLRQLGGEVLRAAMKNEEASAILFQCGFLGSAQEPEVAALLALLRARGEVTALELPDQDRERRVLASTLDDAVDALVERALLATPGPVLLAGQSLGATVALLAGARLIERGHKVAALVCFAPILSPRAWFSRENYQHL